MTIRLVATDLDGTLLRSDGTVSARTARVLAALQASGVVVVLVTGRPPRWMAEVGDVIGNAGVAICANGALVYDMRSEALLSARLLEPALVRALTTRLRRGLPGLRFAVEYGLTFGREPEYEHGWAIGGAVRVEPVETLLDHPVAKLLARHPRLARDELLARAVPLMGADATVTSSSWESLLEISAFGVTKAATLAELAGSFGVAPREVMAFGDMPNDLEMLAWAGRPVAVANAHPDLLAVAHEVTASNDDDGVALVLERLLAERTGAA